MSKRKKQTISKGRQDVNNYQGKLSLVIPCYNESNRIPELFSKLQKFQKDWSGLFEIILVNDGSSDDTLAVLKRKAEEFSSATSVPVEVLDMKQNGGKGAALQAGVKKATGDHILTLDADMSTSPTELIEWLKILPGYTFPDKVILIASREHKDSKVDAKSIRRFAGLIFNFIIQLFTNLKISDTQCGFKLYPAAIAEKLFSHLETKGWAHDVEILSRASINGIKIKEMPVGWNHQDGSKISLVRDSIRMFFQVLGISLRLNWQYFIKEPLQSFNSARKQGEPPVFRFLFVFTVAVLFVLMPLLSFDYGFTGDELVQKEYGEKVLSFFESDGADNSALNYKNLYFYGGLFDYAAAWLNKYVGGLDVYEMRHLLNSLVGVMLFLFTGLLGKELSNSWRVGFLSLLFIALSPRIFGHAMNNPKDIPFAAAYTFTLLYLIRFLKDLPKPGMKTVLLLIVGIAAAINVRVGGILLIAYFGLFTGVLYLWRNDLRRELTKWNGWSKVISLVLLVSVAGYFGGLLYWPYAQQAPLSNPFKSLSEMSNFSVSIKMLFEGRHLWSDELPWYYIPKWMAIGSPLFLVLGVVMFPFLLLSKRKSQFAIYLTFVAFTAIFPVTYAVIKGSSLYDGMRHFLFVVPILAVLGAWAWSTAIQWSQAKYYRYSFSGILVVGLLLPFFWMLRNHPYQTVYFNEVFGGAGAAFGNYEMDYWMNSMKEMCEWLVENDPELKNGGEKTILTSSYDPVSYYLRQLAPNAKVQYVRYTDRHARAGDYFIFFNRFVDRGYLLSGAWPPGELVHQIEVDGAPIAALTKTDPNQYAVNGKIKEDQQDYMGALESYKLAVAQDPRDELAWSGLAKLYLDTQQFDAAKAAIDQLLTLSQSDFGTWYLLGQYHYNRGQAGEALKAFQTCRDLNYKQNIVYYYLALIHLNLGELPKVLENVEAYDKTGGNIAQVYEIGINAANQLSATAASRYFNAKKAFFEGKTQEAYRLASEALEVDPGYDLAREFISRFNTN